MAAVVVTVHEDSGGWLAVVTVHADTSTTHRVGVTHAEHARFGDGDVTELVRRSFEFLLARESNRSILREFTLGDIERYFPEFGRHIRQ